MKKLLQTYSYFEIYPFITFILHVWNNTIPMYKNVFALHCTDNRK